MIGQAVKKGWRATLVLCLLFVIWEIACQLFAIPAWLLPAPSQILQTGVEEWATYQHHLVSTIQLTVIGFLVGSSTGIIVAVILHLVPFLKEAFYPLIILSQNIPIIVLAPLLVIWLGFGMLPKVIVIVLVCFFPIAVSAMEGFQQTDHDLKHYMKMAGASRKQTFWKLEWPNALPYVFSGMKIAATYSVMGAVIAEWLGANKGIGVYMTLASSSFRTDRVFVSIFLVMILSLSFFAFISFLEKQIIKWKLKEED